MSEFMGNLSGTYDAKEKGFIPGSASLHSCMSGHGPEYEVFAKVNKFCFFNFFKFFINFYLNQLNRLQMLI
jgi:hypothetical protein